MELAFYSAVCAGLGLSLSGAANLLLLRRSLALRAAATVIVLAIALLVAAGLDTPGVAARTAQVFALTMMPFVLLGFPPLARALGFLLSAWRRPIVCATAPLVGGVALVVGAVVLHDRAEQKTIEDGMTDLVFIHERVPVAPSMHEGAATDRGTMIELQEVLAPRNPEHLREVEGRGFSGSPLREMAIRLGPPDDRSNCHGWVFTGGRYHLRGRDVDVILRDNDYCSVDQPRPGDLVIYREPHGSIVHSALVQSAIEGEPVLVRSKWGNLGVFLHPVADTAYGNSYSYHRSPRAGHALVLVRLASGASPRGERMTDRKATAPTPATPPSGQSGK